MNNNSNNNAANDNRLEFIRKVTEQNTLPVPSPFKRVQQKKSRRHKAVKQLLSEENKRINAIFQQEQQDNDADKNIKHKRLVPKVTYFNVDAPPSLRPPKKYCDITGLKGPYRSPTTNIRYHNAEIYQLIVKPMAPGVDQEYLKLRGANFVLK
ncbi:Ies6p NDAI_0G00260 [Naumovozyma dairenensis CBS 421]|uniref:Vps72/YL1 C-terminal domain-containing protein n=1 Tax=Naumovozyma dairenensis (strain ATCC 10597 / BCRC 20456 / CBS 421 / NBRC 0211 / NRRL Y-12639) TaxID=1071378 RepID=G0WDE1_NAUDC|nr:hypothetical protein NDAI_0G00260 [Naumovozyma dairenensis CBS 421]CCD25802.2 hypothetical protein NDAI_0G00260 [Naumovozyma dairenensis CBS 421]